jgi:hypothetical protein
MTKSKNSKEAQTDAHSEFITFLFRILLRRSFLTKMHPMSYFVWANGLYRPTVIIACKAWWHRPLQRTGTLRFETEALAFRRDYVPRP